MITALDTAVANITAALKAKQLWHDKLLIVLSSDNGGPGRANTPNNLPFAVARPHSGKVASVWLAWCFHLVSLLNDVGPNGTASHTYRTGCLLM